ncbi:Aldo/keto reductase [Backusella circina FSU 941]|nr:Aldo/keto reductase [Backusella circina FSU 941]
MQYVQFGNTGLRVSRICLGCMTYGSPKWISKVKNEQESIKAIKQAYLAGINYFDTANTYSNGESERLLGKALKELSIPRGRYVVATKVGAPVYDDVSRFDLVTIRDNTDMINRWGTSRKHILDAVDASLERLGLDYIDLYQIHRLDGITPLEEVMETLNDIVRSGKVRYIGASTMAAWQFQKMNYIAEKNGWTKFVSMQNCYNLVYREEEREMIPYCLDAGIAGIPWSVFAMGDLTIKRDRSKTVNSETLPFLNKIKPEKQKSNDTIVDRIFETGEKRNVSPAQIALAWLYTKPFVTCPIIGIDTIEQLYDAMRAMTLHLLEDEVRYLEEAYIPDDPIPLTV